MTSKFAVFILTHGRPDRVVTYETLKRQGYTGDIYVIVDNEDGTIEDYKRRFGDQVIVFDKAAIAQQFDTGDNFSDRRAVVFARNASFGIAETLGLDYFLQLDDDYITFVYMFSASLKYKVRPVKSLDRLFSIVLEYYKETSALSIALGQKGGDFLGGSGGGYARTVRTLRKCMNTFFCSTSRPFTFVGRVNEDVNTYVSLGNRGHLMLTILNAVMDQHETQASAGGMSELYHKEGTYRKSFYTVMYVPSCVTISDLRSRHARIHHRIEWADAVPCIIDEKYKKLAVEQ